MHTRSSMQCIPLLVLYLLLVVVLPHTSTRTDTKTPYVRKPLHRPDPRFWYETPYVRKPDIGNSTSTYCTRIELVQNSYRTRTDGPDMPSWHPNVVMLSVFSTDRYAQPILRLSNRHCQQLYLDNRINLSHSPCIPVEANAIPSNQKEHISRITPILPCKKNKKK